MIDTKLGEQYQGMVCDRCKDKIRRKMEKVNRWALLRPLQLARQFQAVLCSDCRTKIVKEMQAKQ